LDFNDAHALGFALEAYLGGRSVGVVEAGTSVEVLAESDGFFEHGIATAAMGVFDTNSGAAIPSTTGPQVLHQSHLSVAFNDNEGGVPSLAGFLFPGITTRHLEFYRLGMPPYAPAWYLA
jgi:hypothetical protein